MPESQSGTATKLWMLELEITALHEQLSSGTHLFRFFVRIRLQPLDLTLLPLEFTSRLRLSRPRYRGIQTGGGSAPADKLSCVVL